jgi:hypothetical protein
MKANMPAASRAMSATPSMIEANVLCREPRAIHREQR